MLPVELLTEIIFSPALKFNKTTHIFSINSKTLYIFILNRKYYYNKGSSRFKKKDKFLAMQLKSAIH